MQDKDVIIAQLLRQNSLLKEQVAKLKEQLLDFEVENQKLREKTVRLEKNSSNSSRPPSSDIVDPQPANKKKKKRKTIGQKGHPKYSQPAFDIGDIDQTIIHKLPAKEVRRRGLKN